jgi:hypothetical protein
VAIDWNLMARFALLAGVLSILLVAGVALLPMADSAVQQLSFVSSHQSTYGVVMIITLFWATLSIPFVVGLGTVLHTRGSSLAPTATVLSAGGLLLLGFGYYVGNGALLSIATAGHAPAPGVDTYQDAFVDPAGAGASQIVTVPRWVAALGGGRNMSPATPYRVNGTWVQCTGTPMR